MSPTAAGGAGAPPTPPLSQSRTRRWRRRRRHKRNQTQAHRRCGCAVPTLTDRFIFDEAGRYDRDFLAGLVSRKVAYFQAWNFQIFLELPEMHMQLFCHLSAIRLHGCWKHVLPCSCPGSGVLLQGGCVRNRLIARTPMWRVVCTRAS